jgi:hypothetical protein
MLLLAYSILYFVVDRHTVNIRGLCLLAEYYTEVNTTHVRTLRRELARKCHLIIQRPLTKVVEAILT